MHAVQQAVLDLYWVEPWQGPGTVLTQSQFVDGDYGPWTEATVLAYKRHYDIHYPPSAPTGTFDGFTGPATMKSLDKHCTLLDEAAAEIIRHVDDLNDRGLVGSVDLADPDGVGRIAIPIRGSAGGYRTAFVNGDTATIAYKRDIGARELHGPIFYKWTAYETPAGDATGAIGFPTSDVSSSGSVATAMFERGMITHDSSTDATTVSIDPELEVAHHDIEF